MLRQVSIVPDIKFDFAKLKLEVFDIVEKYQLLQIGLVHTKDAKSEHDKIVESTGSLYDRIKQQYIHSEKDFTEFNDLFKGTEIFNVYSQLQNVGRCRILVMHGPSCYKFHKDITKKYHIAVETNTNCVFVLPNTDEKVIHIPADGQVHLLETRNTHSFLNGSLERRIHVVIEDLTSQLSSMEELLRFERK